MSGKNPIKLVKPGKTTNLGGCKSGCARRRANEVGGDGGGQQLRCVVSVMADDLTFQSTVIW